MWFTGCLLLEKINNTVPGGYLTEMFNQKYPYQFNSRKVLFTEAATRAHWIRPEFLFLTSKIKLVIAHLGGTDCLSKRETFHASTICFPIDWNYTRYPSIQICLWCTQPLLGLGWHIVFVPWYWKWPFHFSRKRTARDPAAGTGLVVSISFSHMHFLAPRSQSTLNWVGMLRFSYATCWSWWP